MSSVNCLLMETYYFSWFCKLKFLAFCRVCSKYLTIFCFSSNCLQCLLMLKCVKFSCKKIYRFSSVGFILSYLWFERILLGRYKTKIHVIFFLGLCLIDIMYIQVHLLHTQTYFLSSFFNKLSGISGCSYILFQFHKFYHLFFS